MTTQYLIRTFNTNCIDVSIGKAGLGHMFATSYPFVRKREREKEREYEPWIIIINISIRVIFPWFFKKNIIFYSNFQAEVR